MPTGATRHAGHTGLCLAAHAPQVPPATHSSCATVDAVHASHTELTNLPPHHVMPVP
jgi:hypothetical protein